MLPRRSPVPPALMLNRGGRRTRPGVLAGLFEPRSPGRSGLLRRRCAGSAAPQAGGVSSEEGFEKDDATGAVQNQIWSISCVS